MTERLLLPADDLFIETVRFLDKILILRDSCSVSAPAVFFKRKDFHFNRFSCVNKSRLGQNTGFQLLCRLRFLQQIGLSDDVDDNLLRITHQTAQHALIRTFPDQPRFSDQPGIRDEGLQTAGFTAFASRSSRVSDHMADFSGVEIPVCANALRIKIRAAHFDPMFRNMKLSGVFSETVRVLGCT